MKIVIDTSKFAAPFKAIGRGVSRVCHKAGQVMLDAEARALLRRNKREAAIQARAMELEAMARRNANAEPRKPSTENRGTSRLEPAVQPRRRTSK